MSGMCQQWVWGVSHRVHAAEHLNKDWKLTIEFGQVEVMVTLSRVGLGGLRGWKYKLKGSREKSWKGWGDNSLLLKAPENWVNSWREMWRQRRFKKKKIWTTLWISWQKWSSWWIVGLGWGTNSGERRRVMLGGGPEIWAVVTGEKGEQQSTDAGRSSGIRGDFLWWLLFSQGNRKRGHRCRAIGKGMLEVWGKGRCATVLPESRRVGRPGERSAIACWQEGPVMYGEG